MLRHVQGGPVARIFLCFALVLLALGASSESQGQTSENSPEKKIDALFSGATSPGAPGLTALVRQNGKTIIERGYGMRDLRTKAKIDSHTNFRLASFTKQFTVMAIMLLVHNGKLRYDETLTKIFPDFPDYGKSITIRNLLN